MDSFDNIFLQDHPNRTFQEVSIGERFLRNKNAPNASENFTGNAPCITGLSKCNLALEVYGIDLELLRRETFQRAQDSGIGIQISFIDFGNFVAILNELKNVLTNYNSSSLPPLAEYMHGELTKESQHYFNLGKSMPKQGPIKRMIDTILPFGITTTNTELLSHMPSTDRLKTVVLTNGTNVGNQSFPLVLPFDKVCGLKYLESFNNYGRQSQLFLVVGPSDELHCGELGDTFVHRPFARNDTYQARQVEGSEVVDQAYTAAFFFAEPGDTVQRVLEDAVTRCRIYTQVRKDACVYREAAAIRIGLVPYIGPQTLLKKTDELGSVTSVQIDNFELKLDPQWTYVTFPYLAKDEHQIHPTTDTYSLKRTIDAVTEIAVAAEEEQPENSIKKIKHAVTTTDIPMQSSETSTTDTSYQSQNVMIEKPTISELPSTQSGISFETSTTDTPYQSQNVTIEKPTISELQPTQSSTPYEKESLAIKKQTLSGLQPTKDCTKTKAVPSGAKQRLPPTITPHIPPGNLRYRSNNLPKDIDN